MRAILAEYKIHNADVTLRYDATAEDLIDVIEGNRVYMPCIYILNKIDQISIEELDIIYRIPHCVPISAHHKWNFDDRKYGRIAFLWEWSSLFQFYHYRKVTFQPPYRYLKSSINKSWNSHSNILFCWSSFSSHRIRWNSD